MNRRLSPEEVAKLTGGRVSAQEARQRTAEFQARPQQSPQLTATSYGDQSGERTLCKTFDRARNMSLTQALDVAGTPNSIMNQHLNRQIAEAEGTLPAQPAPGSGGPGGCN